MLLLPVPDTDDVVVVVAAAVKPFLLELPAVPMTTSWEDARRAGGADFLGLSFFGGRCIVVVGGSTGDELSFLDDDRVVGTGDVLLLILLRTFRVVVVLVARVVGRGSSGGLCA
jgi:hypothetical protein